MCLKILNKNFLYHFTKSNSFIKILEDGNIFPYGDSISGVGVSLTRKSNLIWEDTNMRLTFDKNELRYLYKIKPIHWFNIKHCTDYRQCGEDIKVYFDQKTPANQFEERVVTNNPIPIKYIKEIKIVGDISDTELEKITKLVKYFKIPILKNN